MIRALARTSAYAQIEWGRGRGAPGVEGRDGDGAMEMAVLRRSGTAAAIMG